VRAGNDNAQSGGGSLGSNEAAAIVDYLLQGRQIPPYYTNAWKSMLVG